MAVGTRADLAKTGGGAEVELKVTATMRISAFVAQQRATQYVMLRIGNQLCGEAPDLHVGERISWAVPIVLTSPRKGVLGRVGQILVDADTGEVLAGADDLRMVTENARSLAEGSPL